MWVSLLLIVAFSGPGTGDDSMRAQIVASERAGLDCLKSGDVATFAGLIADDAVFVGSRGPASKAEVVRHTADFRLADYSMDDIRFVPVSADSGLIAYKISETGTAHGKDFAAQVYVSALWVRRQGKWVCLFSQETVAR
jgi:ketosteroid isomerase-like protein